MSSPDPLKVAVIGARGRLGAHACRVLADSDEIELVGEFEIADAWLDTLAATGAEVVFEATRAGLGAAHGLSLLDAGVRPVIATSGVSLEDNERLDARARELGLGGLVVPNLSLGIVLLERACRDIAPHLPGASIVEEHRAEKADAPSATALELARVIAAARGTDEEVTIASVREADRYAHHEVTFTAPGERVILRHDMDGPEAFGPGILAAVRYAREAVGVGRGLSVALDREPLDPGAN